MTARSFEKLEANRPTINLTFWFYEAMQLYNRLVLLSDSSFRKDRERTKRKITSKRKRSQQGAQAHQRDLDYNDQWGKEDDERYLQEECENQDGKNE